MARSTARQRPGGNGRSEPPLIQPFHIQTINSKTLSWLRNHREKIVALVAIVEAPRQVIGGMTSPNVRVLKTDYMILEEECGRKHMLIRLALNNRRI